MISAAAQAGDYHQLIVRQGYIDIFEIMHSCAGDAERILLQIVHCIRDQYAALTLGY